MNSNTDESKNNIEDRLSSLSSSFRSGLKSLTESANDNNNNMLSDISSGDSNNLIGTASKYNIFGMDWKIFILIIVIFGLLGVNIFVYLAVGTQDIINLFKPLTMAITNFLQNLFGGTIASIFKNAIKGVYDLLFIIQGTIKGGVSATDQLMDSQSNNQGNSLNTILNTPQPATQSYSQPTSLPQNVASNGSVNDNTSSVVTTTSNQSSTMGQSSTTSQMTPIQNVSANNITKTSNLASSLNNNALNNALNTALVETTSGNYPNNMNGGSNTTYTADDSMSSVQQSKSSSKSGWCFIGEDRGFRSCIQVTDNEKCMSGDIFPSQEICINPNLRQ
jgi:hypothetical protein